MLSSVEKYLTSFSTKHDAVVSSVEPWASDKGLDRLITLKTESLRKCRLRLGTNADSRAGRKTSLENLRRCNTKLNPASSKFTVEERWQNLVQMVPRNFCSSPEAQMKVNLNWMTATEEERRAGCKGTRVDHLVCRDLKRYYELHVEGKANLGQATGTYTPLRSMLGQMVRFSVAHKRAVLEDVWKPGELLALACDEKILRALCFCLQERCRTSTVEAKTAGLLRWCEFAYRDFESNVDWEQRGIVVRNKCFLQTISSAEKREGKREAWLNKDPHTRAAAGKNLSESDMKGMARCALQRLKSIRRALYEIAT